MPRQATLHHMRRLADGRCPTHGAPMAQVGLAEDGRMVIVACTQEGCNIRGMRGESDPSVTLLPEFVHLLDPDKPEV